jgi:glycosyltransferase involved in cell wall biosynthesis
LKSLDETVPEMKKIVVTNGSIPQTFLNEFVGDIHIKEQGQCKAVNAGVAVSGTPWVLVTNDDMIYAPGWWDRLSWFDTNEWSCVSPKLVEPQAGAPTFEVYFCGGAGGDFNKEKWLEFAKQKHSTEQMVWRKGFNMPILIKKELWDLIGGYDVSYGKWGSNSDSDLEYKIRLAGIQPYQNTDCVVYHFSQTSGTFHPDHHDAWQNNFQYFIDKWGFERAGKETIWTADFEIPMDKLKFRPFWMEHYGKANPMQNPASA